MVSPASTSKATNSTAKNFVDASAQQQEVQLRAIDDVEMGNRQRPSRHGNTVPEPDSQLKGPFWVVFKT